jgi:flagellar assembly protein FliH
LSKVFIPQFSSPPDLSREFVSQPSPAGPDPATGFPLEWPDLKFRENGLHSNPAVKEREEKVLKQAKEKALRVEKEAYEKGFAQGEKDGLELGQKKLEPVLDSIRQLLERMNRLHQELYQKYEMEMVQLVLAITRKILLTDLSLPEGAIQETLRAAFQYVVEPKKIVVHLNPKDHQYLLTHPAGLPWEKADEEARGIKIVADSSITRGGCFLETSFGDIDARLESQFDHIFSLIESKVHSSNPVPDRPEP